MHPACNNTAFKQALRDFLAGACSDSELKQWFDPLQFKLNSPEKRLNVLFPHTFFADWFAGSAKGLFEEQVGLFLEPGYWVEYEFGGPKKTGPNVDGLKLSLRADLPFGRQWTFDTFLFGAGNQAAVNIVRRAVQPGEPAYNPLLIQGESGVGKSHLLKAAANEFARRIDPDKVFHGQGHELLQVLDSGGAADQECLLLDDLQQAIELPGLQDRLVTLFDAFQSAQKPMLFALAEPLKTLPRLEPKLRSRLESGLLVHIKPPELEVRVKHVSALARSRNIRLSREQTLTLAQRFRDFRGMSGVVHQLSAFRDASRQDPTDAEFKRIALALDHQVDAKPDAKRILNVVAAFFDLSPEAVTSQGRKQNQVLARQTAMYLCRHLAQTSYPSLGRLFGGRDHSTVIYAVKKIRELERTRPEVKKMMTELKKRCQNEQGEGFRHD